MTTGNLFDAIRHTLAVGVVSACALSFGPGAAAAHDLGAPKASIRYGDLNLASQKGVKTLYDRINSAAYAVCESFGRDSRDNSDPWALQACRKKILADAVSKIDNPALYALYNARNPQHLPAKIVTAESGK